MKLIRIEAYYGHQANLNELTTVAAAFTCAQFFNGLQLSGPLQGVTIAAKNTPNLVNPVTGSWGAQVY